MSQKIALALLIVANILWGSSYAVAKIALEELPPPLLGALRFSLAAFILWLLLLWQAHRVRPNGKTNGIEAVALSDGLKLLGLGLIGVAVSYLFSYWGVSMTTATDASLMIIGEVIFTSLLAVILVKEQLGRWRGMGISLGALGVTILILNNATSDLSGGTGLARAAGDILILAGLLCQATYSVLGAGLSRKYQPLTIVTITYTGSLLVWLPLLAWYIGSGSFPDASFTAIAGVIYLAAVISVLCFLIWFSALKVVDVNLGATTLFLQPLVGGFLGLLLLGDSLTPGLMVGGLLIFTALYLTTLPVKKIAVKQEAIP